MRVFAKLLVIQLTVFIAHYFRTAPKDYLVAIAQHCASFDLSSFYSQQVASLIVGRAVCSK